MIVNHLPAILEELGWSTYRLSEESGLHYRVVNRLVSSRKPSISWEVLDTLCETLDRDVGELFSYKPAASRRLAPAKHAAKKKPSKSAAARKPAGKKDPSRKRR
jgi:DNA-binding Xre family transcriptional regulator